MKKEDRFTKELEDPLTKELYSDIIDALYDEMPEEERSALLNAKHQIERHAYIGKVANDLRISLQPVAIKSELSPNGKKVYNLVIKGMSASGGPAGMETGFGAGVLGSSMFGGF